MSELVRRKAKDIFNVEIEEEDQILVRAAREGRMTIIIGLLSTNMVNINLRSNIDPHIDDDRDLDDYKATPLLEAAKNGHTDIVRLLLDKGAKPNISDKYGDSPLMAAALKGHKEVVKLLIEKGADPNMIDCDEYAALHYAVSMGHNDVIQMLLDNGADPNMTDCDEYAALHCAARMGHNDVIRMLLDIGADPNISNEHGETPLHMAVISGYKNTAVLLLSNGANPNPTMESIYEDRKSPLTIALEAGFLNCQQIDLAQILLDAGAVPNEEDKVKMEEWGCFEF